MRTRMRRRWLLVCLIPALAGASPPPRLGVLLVFDQLSSPELDELAPFFGARGFGGLQGRGAARYDAVYGYCGTETAPGHATLSTGTNPRSHGICANEWFEQGRRIYAVEDPSAPVLGAAPGAMGLSARNLRAGTLGDAMKAQTHGRAKVVSISVKDRAAILGGGSSADLALWFEADQARFTSSKAFVDQLPAWAAELGRTLPTKSLASGRWSPLPVPAELRALVGADVRPGEGAPAGFTTSFPHDLSQVEPRFRAQAYRSTPQAMDDSFALALAAVDHEKLGTRGATDLLVLSISSTDYTGHTFGPASMEKVDLLRRADVAVRRFLEALDARLGSGGYALVLSSDHGVSPLAEELQRIGLPAGRVQNDQVESAAQGALEKGAFAAFEPPNVFFDEGTADPATRNKRLERVASAVRAVPGVRAVYRSDAGPPPRDPVAALLFESLCAGRGGPLLVQSEPYWVYSEKGSRVGTHHATPYNYDRRVPLIVLGGGVKGGRYPESVDPRDAAPTLAFLLGVAPPASAEGRVVPAVGAR